MYIVSFLSGFDQNCLLPSYFNTNHFTIFPSVLAELFHAGTHKNRHDETNSFFFSDILQEGLKMMRLETLKLYLKKGS